MDRGIDEVEMITWIQEKMWKSYRVGHFNKARRGSFSSSSALWSCFKSNNVFSVIHLRSSLNGSKIFALIRLPTIWSQQRHNGTKGRSIEIRSQFASTPWFGSFQNQVTKTFFILYQTRFHVWTLKSNLCCQPVQHVRGHNFTCLCMWQRRCYKHLSK